MRLLRLPHLDLALWVCGGPDPSDAFWNDAMHKLEEHRASRGESVPMYGLVVTLGGSPNARQRAQLARIVGRAPLAVVTNALDNPIKRGIATALSWVLPGVAFFAPGRFEAALMHIDALAHRGQIWHELRRLAPEHATMQAIAAHAGLFYGES